MAYIAEWFKVIQGDRFLGVVTDQNFVRYSAKSGRLHVCKAIDGELLVLNDKFYRDDWMLPLGSDTPVEYEAATVVSIPETEYDILNKVNVTEPVNLESLYNTEQEEEKSEKVPDEITTATIDAVRQHKLEELSAACRESIEGGFDLVLRDGATHHFSLTQNDQINLIDLQTALTLHDELVYHADGELMQFLGEADAQDILLGARKWRNYNLALYNSFKNWINCLEDISAIDAVTYDSEIPDEYCTVVLETLTESF